MAITQTVYIQQVYVAKVDSWCPECLLPSVLRITYGLSFRREALVPAMVSSVTVCGDCGLEIE